MGFRVVGFGAWGLVGFGAWSPGGFGPHGLWDCFWGGFGSGLGVFFFLGGRRGGLGVSSSLPHPSFSRSFC